MNNRRALIGELVSLCGALAVVADAVVAMKEHAWVLGFLALGGAVVYFIGTWISARRGA